MIFSISITSVLSNIDLNKKVITSMAALAVADANDHSQTINCIKFEISVNESML